MNAPLPAQDGDAAVTGERRHRIEVGHYVFRFRSRRAGAGTVEVANDEIGEGWFEIGLAQDLFENHAMRTGLHHAWSEGEEMWREVQELTRLVFERLNRELEQPSDP